MKKILIYLAAIVMFFGAVGFYESFASVMITFDEDIVTPATNNGEQIADTFADKGIHFITDTTFIGGDGCIYYGSTIVPPGPGMEEDAIYWYPNFELYIPTSIENDGDYRWDDYNWKDYPYPESQYIAMIKPEGVPTEAVGVAIRFDYLCTKLEFNYRRPGPNDRETAVTISFFDTTKSKTCLFSEPHTAYVFARCQVDPDHDGWKDYSSKAPAPFNLVMLSSDKKLAIDNIYIDGIIPIPDENIIPTGLGDANEDMQENSGDDGDDSYSCFISNIQGWH